MGKEIEVRKSISNKAQFPKYMMVELVEFALETCKELEIKVPTKKELGYNHAFCSQLREMFGG